MFQQLYMHTYQNPNNRKKVLAQSEIERRWDYIAQLHKIQLIKQCLDNDPEVRPLANVILQ